MIVRFEVGQRDLLTDPHPKEIAELRLPFDCLEEASHQLGGGVIGSHSVTHQPVRRVQALVNVNALNLRMLEQLIGGEDAGRTSPDNRDPEGSGTGESPLLRHQRHRSAVGVREGFVVGGVEVDERQLIGSQSGIRHDRTHWARGRASTTTDAGGTIDVQHLGGAEPDLTGRWMDAVDGAGDDARRISATGLFDHIGHDKLREVGGSWSSHSSGLGLAPESR